MVRRLDNHFGEKAKEMHVQVQKQGEAGGLVSVEALAREISQVQAKVGPWVADAVRHYFYNNPQELFSEGVQREMFLQVDKQCWKYLQDFKTKVAENDQKCATVSQEVARLAKKVNEDGVDLATFQGEVQIWQDAQQDWVLKSNENFVALTNFVSAQNKAWGDNAGHIARLEAQVAKLEQQLEMLSVKFQGAELNDHQLLGRLQGMEAGVKHLSEMHAHERAPPVSSQPPVMVVRVD